MSTEILPTYQFVTRHFYQPPGKIGLLYGDRTIYPTATIVASEIIHRNGSVVFVDAANRVDPYYLARLARYRGIDPDDMLRRAFVARSFTFYQFDITLTEGLLEFMQSVHASSLIILGPLDLADDNQVPLADVYDILRRVHLALHELTRAGISTLMVSRVPHFQLKDRQGLFPLLRRSVDTIYRTEATASSHHIMLEEGIPYGTNTTDSHHGASARRSKLVEIPPGAQKRGSRYS